MYWVWEGLRPLATLWGLYGRHHGRKGTAPCHSGTRKYNLLLLEKANKNVKLKQSFAFKHNLPFTKLKVGRKVHTSAGLTSYNGPGVTLR